MSASILLTSVPDSSDLYVMLRLIGSSFGLSERFSKCTSAASTEREVLWSPEKFLWRVWGRRELAAGS